MKVLNQSRIPKTVLLPILRWVALQAKEGARKNAYLLFTDGTDPHSTKHSVVTADAFPNGGWLAGMNERHLVEVHVPRDLFTRHYPVRQRYLDAHEVEFQSWDEELAYTLAHEFRHLEQFGVGWVPSPAGNTPEDRSFEANAESFAHNALVKYRKWRDRYIADKLAAFSPLPGPEEPGAVPRHAAPQPRAARRLAIAYHRWLVTPWSRGFVTFCHTTLAFIALWCADSAADLLATDDTLHEVIERVGIGSVVLVAGLNMHRVLKRVDAVTAKPWSYARRTDSIRTDGR